MAGQAIRVVEGLRSRFHDNIADTSVHNGVVFCRTLHFIRGGWWYTTDLYMYIKRNNNPTSLHVCFTWIKVVGATCKLGPFLMSLIVLLGFALSHHLTRRCVMQERNRDTVLIEGISSARRPKRRARAMAPPRTFELASSFSFKDVKE